MRLFTQCKNCAHASFGKDKLICKWDEKEYKLKETQPMPYCAAQHEINKR